MNVEALDDSYTKLGYKQDWTEGGKDCISAEYEYRTEKSESKPVHAVVWFSEQAMLNNII